MYGLHCLFANSFARRSLTIQRAVPVTPITPIRHLLLRQIFVTLIIISFIVIFSTPEELGNWALAKLAFLQFMRTSVVMPLYYMAVAEGCIQIVVWSCKYIDRQPLWQCYIVLVTMLFGIPILRLVGAEYFAFHVFPNCSFLALPLLRIW